jgi:arginine decarboxylase
LPAGEGPRQQSAAEDGALNSHHADGLEAQKIDAQVSPEVDGADAWSAADSSELYGLNGWGQGYFRIGKSGCLEVSPRGPEGPSVKLQEIVDGLAERGYESPILLRFSDLLEHRLGHIRRAFDAAIEDFGYAGNYRCVYPIKVNQQRQICEEIRDLAGELGFGLEAGSKPELLGVLGLTTEAPEIPIVCNGFKDAEFIETVILATKLGRDITPIVEKFSELEMIVAQAKKHDVRPKIGIRVKLGTSGAGRWEKSGGSRSKFGLFVSEVLRAVDYLREHEMLDCLQLVHAHMGSQINDVRSLQQVANELARVYAELHRLGAGVKIVDIGGGLGVDYDGSQTASSSSVNYTLESYALEVIHRVMAVCDEVGVPHPDIYSESGRAMVAYSSVLICNVVGSSRYDSCPDEAENSEDLPQPLKDLWEVHGEIGRADHLENYHWACGAYDQAKTLFAYGHLSLEHRSMAEELFWSILRRIVDAGAQDERGFPEELQEMAEKLTDIYFCNFSLFQSLPDSWAVDQIFPICPLARLNEKPERIGILADITCDSDGQIERFADRREEKKVLELHNLRPGEPYHLGFFLVGAYQEILGDLHNLLGDTHAVHVRVDESGWSVEDVVEGDTVDEVLGYVQWDTQRLRRDMRRDIERALRRGDLSVTEGKDLLRSFLEGLNGYTYLEG